MGRSEEERLKVLEMIWIEMTMLWRPASLQRRAGVVNRAVASHLLYDLISLTIVVAMQSYIYSQFANMRSDRSTYFTPFFTGDPSCRRHSFPWLGYK